MCGILGVIGSDAALVESAARRGLKAMAHRGPDDEGLCVFPFGDRFLALAHARLSIIDTSESSRQPMVRGPLPSGGRGAVVSGGDGAAIVFNGEIYNHRSLRTSLEASDRPFHPRTSGDTEVLLEGLAREGESFLPKLRGMFAFAFAEPSRARLTLVRDRLGIKPLYLAERPDGLVFASEVRAILATGLVAPVPERTGLARLLAYGAAQDPVTPVAGVRSLMPGHLVRLEGGRLGEPRRWWDLPRDVDRSRSRAEWVHDIRRTLEETVTLHLEADVPVGAFLSGGVDSSTLVALMASRQGASVRTSTVVCEGETDGEGAYAKLVADRYGTRHAVESLSDGDAQDRVLRSFDALDLPSVDGANTYVVSESIRRAGCTVALSGLGSDELFLGYRHFHTLRRDQRLGRLPGLAAVGRLAGGVVPIGLHVGQRAASMASSAGELGELLSQRRRFLFPAQVARLMTPMGGAPEDAAWPWPVDPRAFEDPLSAASVFELGGYCQNMLLRDSDAMSMAHGLELRVPFLDHVLVEKVLRVPGEWKLPRDGVNKPLLVEAVQDLLPEEVYRRRKRGFSLDLAKWMRGPLRAQMARTFRRNALLHPPTVDNLWAAFLAGDDHLTGRVWGLARILRWYERNLGV